MAKAGDETDYVESVQVTWADTERGRGPLGTAIRTRKPCVCQHIGTNPNFAPWRDEALKRGYAAVLSLPLVCEKALLGGLTIAASEFDAFDEAEIQLLSELANDLAFGVLALRTRAERDRVEQELRKAQTELERRVAERTSALAEVNKSLRESEALYHSLVENLPINVIRKDRQGRFTFGNTRFCRTLDQKLEQIIGKTDYDYYPRELAEKYQRDDRNVIETGIIFQDTEEHVQPDGQKLYVQVTKAPVYDPYGQIDGTECVFWNVTERKRMEEELRQAMRDANAANRAKSAFLAAMSHEVRTPMNGILGMTELALETELTHEQREYLTHVKKSADFLLGVINDILDFSKIEADKLSLECVPFRLRAELDEMLAIPDNQARQKGLKLIRNVAADVPEVLVGDPRRLRQVFENLVANALKFTERGEVFVLIDVAERHDDAVTLRCSVRDTGIGIPPEMLDLIFEPFVQVDGSLTRKYSGTGLGLAISSRLVAMMGGRLTVQSQVGHGSTFHFTASFELNPDPPYGAASKSAPVAPLAAEGRHAFQRTLRILVAEDNLVNRKLAASILRKLGHSVQVVCNGREALAAFERRKFDVILMDVQMPEMNGLQATAAIRENEKGTGLHIPIIAITAYAMKGDREQCLEAGMDAYLVKPIRKKDLIEAIEAAIPSAAKAEDEPPSTPESAADSTWDEALVEVGGDRQLLVTLAEIFLAEYPKELKSIGVAIEQGDCAGLLQAAHTLKGELATFSAQTAMEAAWELECMGRNCDLAAAPTTLTALTEALNRLRPDLAALAGESNRAVQKTPILGW